jgi:hypothetical protein
MYRLKVRLTKISPIKRTIANVSRLFQRPRSTPVIHTIPLAAQCASILVALSFNYIGAFVPHLMQNNINTLYNLGALRTTLSIPRTHIYSIILPSLLF